MTRERTWVVLALFALALLALAARVQTEVSARIEVHIPERSATLYLTRAGASEAHLPGAMLASRSGGAPAYCDDPATASLCLGDRDAAIYFDLRCATLGELPAHCASRYPELGGRLLDDAGRPYPPLKLDASGRVIPGSKRFPQFFTHPAMQLFVFTQAASWQLSVRLEAPLLDPVTSKTLDGAHLAVRAGAIGEASTPSWKCLGYAPDWPLDTVCPAPAAADGVLLERVEGYPGGWQAFALGVRLRLDGSEVPGNYEGTLTYVYTEL